MLFLARKLRQTIDVAALCFDFNLGGVLPGLDHMRISYFELVYYYVLMCPCPSWLISSFFTTSLLLADNRLMNNLNRC